MLCSRASRQQNNVLCNVGRCNAFVFRPISITVVLLQQLKNKLFSTDEQQVQRQDDESDVDLLVHAMNKHTIDYRISRPRKKSVITVVIYLSLGLGLG